MTEIDDVYAVVLKLRDELLERFETTAEEIAEPKRKRITKDEILAAHLAAMTHTGSEHSSARLARNAKGDTQIEVVVRTGDTPEIATAADALAEAIRLYTNACELLPMTNGDARSRSKAATDEPQS